MKAPEGTTLSKSTESMHVGRAMSGDRDSWQLLMRIHAPRLAAYLGARLRRPSVVDRLVGEAIVKAWKHLEHFSGDDFGAWFRSIGAKLAMGWHSRHKGEPLWEEFPIERCKDEDAPNMQALDRAMGYLPEASRMALEQRFRAGLTGDDLGKVLHLSAQKAEEAVDRALVELESQYRRLALAD